MIDTVHAFVSTPEVLAAGASDGPLAGRTLAVKDVFDVRSTVTGAGNPTFAAGREPAAANADAVQRLVDGGATVVGKTITDELAYSLAGTNVHFGTPVNSAAPDRVPGGSSAGSAAAVAAGLCDLALGTDTGGSIRVPASYCGLAGWRPTHGAVSSRGVVHLARSFDTVGVLTRDLELLSRAADLLLGSTDAGAVVSTVRVAELFDVLQPSARVSAEAATAGWVDGTTELGVELAAAAEAFRTLQGREAWAEHGAWITRARPAMGPGIAQRFEAASKVTAEQVDRASIVRDDVRRLVDRATVGGRVLVGPAAVGAAPRADEPVAARTSTRSRSLQLTCLAGLAGAPVLVLPIASDDGLPFGIACVGAPGSDRALLRWALERFEGAP